MASCKHCTVAVSCNSKHSQWPWLNSLALKRSSLRPCYPVLACCDLLCLAFYHILSCQADCLSMDSGPCAWRFDLRLGVSDGLTQSLPHVDCLRQIRKHRV
jgi:hypothetical protein